MLHIIYVNSKIRFQILPTLSFSLKIAGIMGIILQKIEVNFHFTIRNGYLICDFYVYNVMFTCFCRAMTTIFVWLCSYGIGTLLFCFFFFFCNWRWFYVIVFFFSFFFFFLIITKVQDNLVSCGKDKKKKKKKKKNISVWQRPIAENLPHH